LPIVRNKVFLNVAGVNFPSLLRPKKNSINTDTDINTKQKKSENQRERERGERERER
jgi:hypothetical protein